MWGAVSLWQDCLPVTGSRGRKPQPKLKAAICKQAQTLDSTMSWLVSRFVSSDRTATSVTLQLSMDPFSNTGQDWLDYVRAHCRAHTAAHTLPALCACSGR
jgi:hypothetical protein